MVTVKVRPACAQDVEALASLHRRAFPEFFLTTLGRRFVSELYRGFLQSSAGRIFVADLDERIAGFAAGTFAPDHFFRDLLRTRWFAFGWAAMGAAARHPRAVVPRLLSAITYRGERPPQLHRAALLSSIAVDPRASRSGIGTLLLSSYCNEAWKEGLQYVYLLTDRDENEPVNRFYIRQGFRVDTEIRRRNGRIMLRYVRAAAPSQASQT
jgi:colanic acid biosynthesis glycosyl transferase WcaI